MKPWNCKHLFGIEELTSEEISQILDQTVTYKKMLAQPIPKNSELNGVTIVLFFCEPSTRTRSSFELAARRLGADVLNVNLASSSMLKGETLKDTVANLAAMRVEIIIMRHTSSGSTKFISRLGDFSVINAGDGFHEHPTQALLDVFTIRERYQQLANLNVSIIGDIAHSRVARSNIWALKRLGAKVTVCGPKTLIPKDLEKIGVTITYDLREAVRNADVINVLRIQLERQSEAFFPNIREYAKYFGINQAFLQEYAKSDVMIIHPGPINREIELSSDVADGKHSLILDQVTNGIAVRMATLHLVNQARTKSEN